MRIVYKIMKKELLRWSNMTVFYILFAILVFCIGLYTWFFYEDNGFFELDRVMPASLEAIFWALAIFVPMLGIGVVLEERKSRTWEVLLAKPVHIRQLIFGKLAAIKVVIFLLLSLTMLYYCSIVELASTSWDYLLPIYLFLFIQGVAYAAISMAVASFFDSYWKSYLWSYLIVFSIHFLAGLVAYLSTGEVQSFFSYLGLDSHFSYFLSGGFAASSLVYLFSIITIGVFTTIYKLSRDYSCR